MRTVPGLILSAAALLQFFSGFASAVDTPAPTTPSPTPAPTPATCNGLSYVCQTDGFVRDIDRDTIECVADADFCSDADCCIEGEICADFTCTIAETMLKSSDLRALCADNNGVCADDECCVISTAKCESYTCQGIGMELVSATETDPLCTNECDDAQCCAVKSKCKHYTCTENNGLNNMVLNPAEEDNDCSDGTTDGMCNDAVCCMVTCASDGVVCDAGTRLDDNVCDAVDNGANGCVLVSTNSTNSINPVIDVCCTDTKTCTEELHACPTGYHRIGANNCPETGLCTDALCCEANIVPTITESRMMQTPPSRQHLMQYGTS